MRLILTSQAVYNRGRLISFITLLPALIPGLAQAQTRATGAQVQILTSIQTDTSYAISVKDCGKLLSFSNASPIDVSLPQPGATGLYAGCWMDIQNTGAGALVLTPDQSQIDGASSLRLLANQGVRLVSTGSTYLTERGSSSTSASSGGIGNCALSGDNNDDLTCHSISSYDPSRPGQLSLFDLAASPNYFAWAAPSAIPASYTAQVPAAQPNGQVMRFSAPSAVASIAAGEWVTLGALATQDPILPSQLPAPSNPGFWLWYPAYTGNGTANIYAAYGAPLGGQSMAFTAGSTVMPDLTYGVQNPASSDTNSLVWGIYSYAGTPKVPTTLLCSVTVTGAEITVPGPHTVSWTGGNNQVDGQCLNFIIGDQYALVFASNDTELRLVAIAEGTNSQMTSTKNPAFAGGTAGVATGTGSSIVFADPLPVFSPLGAGAQAQYPLIRTGN